MLGFIIVLAIGWSIYRAVKRKGSVDGLLAQVMDPKHSEEKKRGTRWLIAAVVVANMAQATLKNAHRSGDVADWVLGGLWAAGMAYCMWRSWQYLYLGKKADAAKPATDTPPAHTAPPVKHSPAQAASHRLPAGTLNAAANRPHPSQAPKKSKDKQFQQL
jgi:hypothetical protein